MKSTRGKDVEDGKCSIYGALARVGSDRSVLPLSADGFQRQHGHVTRLQRHARTRDSPRRGKCYRKVMRRSSGAWSVCWTIPPTRVTTGKRMESQRLPRIHSERSYCVVCLVLVFTTVRFQSAMLGKKCFSLSKQHNVLVLMRYSTTPMQINQRNVYS